ncbi:siderophore-interacting protein [Pseudomonas oryzihabitans]|uniref:NADPH-dependent ferric siderophore reductase n=1 Tax=Pseudomonas oryzihabitans TaxID=47885 RepID=A0AAJ2BN21_9PSED|nr:siderophore-interacting protein [Pseudomonas psychrotolerans]MDR6234321.1 NADPH-dependent ferric siderophore reductase [Pseudomonas psychrotolerans]MDR6356560.1 NADPH-dependent ferric siderophore reductase [Pseudomonas psychrotolerans]
MATSFHSPEGDANARHVFNRVRFELKRRWATVVRREELGGDLLRLTFGGSDLADFQSAAFDEHVKLFVPADTTPIRAASPEQLVGRHYTPRHYDAAHGELAIDFYLHEAGVLTTWARQAQPGAELIIGGPKGALVPPEDFDWYLLAGDETALPAIARRLEQLATGVRVLVIAEIARPGLEIALPTAADADIRWVHRDRQPDALLQALQALELPAGEGYAWVAGEAGQARAARQALLAKGLPRDWVKAAGYWKLGESDQHVKLDD